VALIAAELSEVDAGYIDKGCTVGGVFDAYSRLAPFVSPAGRPLPEVEASVKIPQKGIALGAVVRRFRNEMNTVRIFFQRDELRLEASHLLEDLLRSSMDFMLRWYVLEWKS
jgi:hypothetical protein